MAACYWHLPGSMRIGKWQVPIALGEVDPHARIDEKFGSRNPASK